MTGCGINEIHQFQLYYAPLNTFIIVYGDENFGKGEAPIYDGTRFVLDIGFEIGYTLKFMYFAKINHFRPILNLKAVAGSRYYCIPCNKKYENDRYRRCSSRCYKCFQIPRCEPMVPFQRLVTCDSCNREFLGRDCFERHKVFGSYKSIDSVCLSVRHCSKCLNLIKIDDPVEPKYHEFFCNTCLKRTTINHLC